MPGSSVSDLAAPSLASLSAVSLPAMFVCPGTQAALTVRLGLHGASYL